MSLFNPNNTFLTSLSQNATQRNYRVWSQEMPAFSLNAAQQQVFKLARITLAPIQPNDSFKKLKDRFNQTFSWEISRIQVLVDQVLASGVVTAQDQPKLAQIEKDLRQLESELKQNHILSQSEFTEAQKAIQEAQKLLLETSDLFKYFKQYQKQLEGLDQAKEEFFDKCYDAEEGEPLNGLPGLQVIFGKLGVIGDSLSPLMNHSQIGTVAGVNMLALYDHQMRSNTHMTEDWSEAVVNKLQRELNTLHALSKHKDPKVRVSAHSQMEALKEHSKAMQRQVEGLRTRILTWQKKSESSNAQVESINTSIAETTRHLQGLEDRLDGFFNGFEAQLADVDRSEFTTETFGTPEWINLVKNRPLPKKSWMGQLWEKTCTYLNPFGYIPEKWRPSSQQLKGLFLTALAVGEQVHKYSKIPKQVEKLRQHADLLQSQVFRDVPAEKVKRIDNETGRIGKILNDNYEAATDKKILDKMTKGHENVRKALQAAVDKFGSSKPTPEQIKTVLDAYRVQRMVQESPSANPFKSDSFADWWQVFTAPEISIQAAAEEMSPPVTSAAATANGIVPSMLKGLGKLFGTLNFFAETNTLPKSVHKESYQAIRTALNAIPSLQHTLQVTPALKELQQEANLLHQQLLNAVAETPEAQCSLPKLALWSQQVEDVCYALKDLEGRVSKVMEAARREIEGTKGAQTDAELERYGKKYMNSVKQARVVESLKLPGVIVPMSHAISSDHTKAYLQKEAIEVFEYWKDLEILYSKYEGKKPFLEIPEVVEKLKAIDQALKTAFERAVDDPKAFLPPEFISWLTAAKLLGIKLMIRSTGSEDSRKTANAGGNISKSYVEPEMDHVISAIGEVVQSYFSYASLQNRLNAGLNPFNEELRLAVMTQELIGELIGGATNSKDIPISLVLFSNEPLYTGEEDFRIMRLSATYGHGEGVVGNLGIASDTILIVQSLTQPDKLLISYDNQEKPERLAPVSTSEGVRLKKVANPSELATKPALSKEMLARLFHLGIIMERFFENHPTDMEIVIKGDTIYPVQARPVNRQELTPTYIDMRKIATLSQSPIVSKVRGEEMVIGKAAVVIVQEQEQVLYKPLLEDAERAFNKELHQLVLAGKEEPSNSHPVVNFSALGMPCLYLPNAKEGLNLIARIDERYFLAADVQTGMLYLWDTNIQSKIEDFTSNGFAVHPAKIRMSLPGTMAQISPTREVPQDVKDLLLTMRSATTREAALKTLNELQKHGWLRQMVLRKAELADKIKATPNPLAQQHFQILTGIESQAIRAFEETRKAFTVGERLESLFHAKVLETTIMGARVTGISQYALADVGSIAASTERLINYQQQLAHPAHFSEMLVQGYDQAPFTEISEQWQKFLLQLEHLAEASLTGSIKGENAIIKEEIKQFKELVDLFAKTNTLPGWLLFSFSPIAQKEPQIVLRKLLDEVPKSGKQFLRRMVREQADFTLIERHLERFADPKAFDDAYQELLNKVDVFSIPSTIDALLTSIKGLWEKQPEKVNLKEFNALSNALQQSALQTMEELVGLYDSAIKTMKMSSLYTDAEKLKLFKQMIGPYLALMENWTTHFLQNDQMIFGNLANYLKIMREIFDELLDNDGIQQLQSSPNFSVAAAALGSGTLLIRHLPKNLEDIFTLVHQNLLVCTSRLNQNILAANKNIQWPTHLQKTMDMLEQEYLNVFYRRKLPILGVRTTSTGIEIRYNLPLRGHSSQLVLNYNKITGFISLSAYFYGENRDRWNQIEEVVYFFNEAGIVPLMHTIKKNEQEVSFSWNPTTENSMQFAFREYFEIGESTNAEMSGYIHSLPSRLDKSGFKSQWESALLRQTSSPGFLSNQKKAMYAVILDRFNTYPKFDSFSDTTKAILWSKAKNPYQIEYANYFLRKLQGASTETLTIPSDATFEKYLASFSDEIESDLINHALLVAKLIAIDDRIYKGDIVIKIFRELLSRGHTSQLEELFNEWSNGNDHQRDTLYNLLDVMIEEGMTELVEKFALKKITSGDVRQRRISQALLVNLIRNGRIYNDAEALVLRWKNEALQHKKKLKSEIFPLCHALIDKGQALDLARSIAIQAFQANDPQCLPLFKALISKESDPELNASAFAAANHWEQNEGSIQLLIALVDKGYAQGYVQAEKVAVAIIKEAGINRRIAIDLLIALNKQNIAIQTFKDLAYHFLRAVSFYQNEGCELLFEKAIQEGLFYREALDVVQEAQNSKKYGIAYSILAELVNHGQAVQEAENFAMNVDNDQANFNYRMITHLVKKGYGYETALNFALRNLEKGTSWNDERDILQILFQKKIGFKEAQETIDRMQKSDNKDLLDVATKLIELIQEHQQGEAL